MDNKFVNGTMLSNFAKKLKSNIKSDLLGDKKLRYLTQAEYDALTDDEKNDENIFYNITDANIEELFSGDYNDLENKPCYDTREFETISSPVVFNGDLTDKTVVELVSEANTMSSATTVKLYFVKISDAVPVVNGELFNIEMTMFDTFEGDVTNQTQNLDVVENDSYISFGDDSIVFVYNESTITTTYNGECTLTPGIWFYGMQADSYEAYVKNYNMTFLLEGELKKLPSQFVDYMPGKKLEGETFVVSIAQTGSDGYPEQVDNVEKIAEEGSEIFNDYENNKATGEFSHSEGTETMAVDTGAHAEGVGTKALGYAAHAEGNRTSALGNGSHSEGIRSITIGAASHSEGYETEANGERSHAEGANTKTARGTYYGHAEGYYTEANGQYASHAEGYYTKASSNYQHVQGKFNIEDTEEKYAHIVGNGTANANRKNAHTLDWEGNAWFAGDVQANNLPYTTNQESLVMTISAEDITNSYMESIGIYSVDIDSFDFFDVSKRYWIEFAGEKLLASNYSTFNRYDVPYSGFAASNRNFLIEVGNEADGYFYVDLRFAEPDSENNTITDINVYVEEVQTLDPKYLPNNLIIHEGISMGRLGNVGMYSTATGFNVRAIGHCTHAEGRDCTAFADYSHAEGRDCSAYGQFSHAEGDGCSVEGSGAHAEGYGCIAIGDSSHAEGNRTKTLESFSHSEGWKTVATAVGQHVQGKYNIEDTEGKYAHIVGNGNYTYDYETGETTETYSNAHTLDWDGNAWFQGNVSIDGTPTNDNNLVTKKYVDDVAANKVDVVEGKALVNTGEIARLSKVDNYNDTEVRGLIEDLSESKADATSIPTKVSQLTNDSGFLTAVPDTYATQAYVTDAINKAQLDGSDSEIDLSPYALTSDLALKADKTELHEHENQTILNSITAEHLTSMAEISDTLNGPKNYYNAEMITESVYLNSDGRLLANTTYFTTDYIPIAPGQTLYFYGANGRYDVQSNARFVGFFDAGKNFITGSRVENVNQITNTYENGAYIKVTIANGGWGLGYIENVYPGVDIKYGEIPESKLWEKPQKIDVFLPDNIYCTVGTTIELYNNQVCLQADKLHLNWCCDYGHAMKRKFSFEGTSALAGQIIPVTLEIYNDYNVLKYTKTIQIHVVAAAITNTITCVPIGDSWTNQKPWLSEVINLSGEKVSFVGKFTATVKDANGNWREYNHEGRSGFSAYSYDGANAYTFGDAGEDTYHAFYNPTTARFDWNNYVDTVLGGTQPGAVILQMGINGIAADNTGMVGHEVNMINLIRQDNADIPIFVTLPAYKGNQDGLGIQESTDGHAYHKGVYDYLEKQKVMNYCSLLYEACKDMVGVYFIPLNICFDSEYNYGAQEVPVNPRATSIIEKIPMEAVHPQDYGYYQMADIVYSVICGNLS